MNFLLVFIQLFIPNPPDVLSIVHIDPICFQINQEQKQTVLMRSKTVNELILCLLQ